MGQHFVLQYIITGLYIVLTTGCSSEPLSPVEFLTIVEKVQQNPQQAISICSSLSQQKQKEDCLLVGVEKLRKVNVAATEEICEYLEQNRGECFFRLAEVSESVQHCEKATPFQEDCQLHLLTKILQQQKIETVQESLPVLERLSLSIEEPNPKTVLYRHLLAKEKPLPIQNCQRYPHPQACLLAAEGLYVDRLRYARDTNRFPCDNLGALEHSNHPTLLREYNRFHQEVCP